MIRPLIVLVAAVAAWAVSAAPSAAGPVYLALGDSSAFGETDRTRNPSNGDRGYVAPFADYLGQKNGGTRPTVLNLGINGETTGSYSTGIGPRGREPWSMPVSDFAPVPPPAVPPTSPPASPPVVPPTTPAAKATVTRVNALTATEGTAATHTLATVNLPDGPVYRVTVFWGDGRTAVGTLTRTTGTTFTISAAYTYPFPGPYAVMIRVTADFKTVLSIDTTAIVADARFYAGRVAQRMAAGEFFGVVATIQDMNPTGGRATDYTATIDWGGGRKSEGIVRKTAAGKFEIIGRNTFEQTGRTTATVTIHSNGGATATAVSLFTIDPAKPPPPA